MTTALSIEPTSHRSNSRFHRKQTVIWAFALLALCAARPAIACAGAISVAVSFARGDSQLSASERSKLESGVQKARAATGAGEPKAALAIYSQESEASSKAEVNRLTERRVLALREGLAGLGMDASSVIAVRGDPMSLQTPMGPGGLAEVEIAFACESS